jgi:hypothetical protein
MLHENNAPEMYGDPFQEKVLEKWSEKMHDGKQDESNTPKAGVNFRKNKGSKFSRIVRLLVRSL